MGRSLFFPAHLVGSPGANAPSPSLEKRKELPMLPKIIQGGMGVYVSTPFLANAVSQQGGLGTVSGVAADKILARLLQAGDLQGHFRRALSHFPFPGVAREVLEEYFVPGGITPPTEYKTVPALTLEPSRMTIALHLCANFAFVWLAKEGHDKPVSINWLEKMQMAHIFSIAGAMLAGVDVITMGAGIPLQVPSALDALAQGRPAEYRVTVTGCDSGTMTMCFDPRDFLDQLWPEMRRPEFLPIVSSDVLAKFMMKRMPGGIQGFVVEAPSAGGHNAPPRGKLVLNESGEPVYGEMDKPDFEKMKSLGVPFWIGGSYASPAGLARAQSLGAQGIQVGSIFALCAESGLDPQYRQEVIRQWHRGQLRIKKDLSASPTGFPFQVAQLSGTLSDDVVYRDRPRACNQHGLATPHQLPDGTIVYRCPAEPVNVYERHGGNEIDTRGVRCICNGLISATGLGDVGEPAIVTLGDDLGFLRYLTKDENGTYTLAQAIEYLSGPG